MKINKKGFTLIELLAVIIVLGLVLSVSTYFVVVSIKSSKQKAFEASKKGLLNSAIAYANEFNEEKDWVEGDPEYTCVSAWWLVNKGMQKKESFATDANEEYKFKKKDVVVLYRDRETKVITDANLVSSAPETCKNILQATASLTSTFNTVTVNGTCEIKDTIPDGILYKYCIRDSINSNCTGYTNESSHTFSGLTNSKNYMVSLECKLGDDIAENDDQIETKALKSPSITCDESASSSNSNHVRVNFNNSDNSLVKTVGVDKVGVKDSNGDIGTTKQYTSSPVDFNISEITGDYVRFTATVSANDGNSNNTKTQSKDCYKNNQVETATPLAPYFIASDGISSGSPKHVKNFILYINSYNEKPVDYYYGTSKNNISTKYDEKNGIDIAKNSDNGKTYYAIACDKNNTNNCSNSVEYKVIFDTTAPTLNVNISRTSNANSVSAYSEKYNNSLAWLPYNVTIYYTYNDGNGVGIDETTAKFKYNYEMQSSLNDSEELVDAGVIDAGEKSYIRSISLDGDRKFYFKICDKAGNCTEKYTYFRTDTQEPVITDDPEGTNINNNKIRIHCSALSGIKESTIYADGVSRYGFASSNGSGYNEASNGIIDHNYINGNGNYASCTNEAGVCSKVKIVKGSSQAAGCYYRIRYYYIRFGGESSTANMCYRTETVPECGGKKRYYDCTIVDSSKCSNLNGFDSSSMHCFEYKERYYGTLNSNSFVLEKQSSC